MIIDTFLYSEPHENHLLWLKMYHENPFVEKFIIQENAYDFKGKYKGLHAHKTMQEDRFAPFREKTIIISKSQKWKEGDTRENINFEREKWQRSLCLNYLKDKYTHRPEVGIIISDTDEFFDFTCKKRLLKFKELWNQNKRWYQRRRYWYSFDNLCLLPSIRIPVFSLGEILHNPNLLFHARHTHINDLTYNNWNFPIAFEFSYVFYSWKDIQRKHSTYAHNDLDAEEDVKEGLRLNAWIRSKKRNEPRTQYDYFETIKLNYDISTRYIVDNLEKINTNIINRDYVQQRQS